MKLDFPNVELIMMKMMRQNDNLHTLSCSHYVVFWILCQSDVHNLLTGNLRSPFSPWSALKVLYYVVKNTDSMSFGQNWADVAEV